MKETVHYKIDVLLVHVPGYMCLLPELCFLKKSEHCKCAYICIYNFMTPSLSKTFGVMKDLLMGHFTGYQIGYIIHSMFFVNINP